MVQDSTAKARLNSFVTSELKLRDGSVQPFAFAGARRPNAVARTRSTSVFGAAWSVAHNSMVTPSN